MAPERDVPRFIAWLSELGDLTRLRLLRLLSMEELGVGELARILQLPQSTVSRHLKLLLEGGWVVKRPAGTASLYRHAGSDLAHDGQRLWKLALDQLVSNPAYSDDLHRLQEALAARDTDSQAFFGRIGGAWDELREGLFGERFTSEALLGLIDTSSTVADLGCGTGEASEQLAPVVSSVIAVDREPAMLKAAKKRLRGLKNVEFVRAELAALPFDDRAIDAAVMSLVLHHIADPVVVLAEAARVVRPGGVLLVVDMVAHDRDSYRHTMGHLHLGFDEQAMREHAESAGLSLVRYRRLRSESHGKGPGLFAATLSRSDRS